jgi:hypothetical protein
MTESDLIWLAPWAAFAAGLMAVVLRLRRTRRSARRTPRPRARQSVAGRPGHDRRRPAERAKSNQGTEGQHGDPGPGPGG